MSRRRLALVTGASAGIGTAFAWLLAREGLDLVLTARRSDRLEALASQIEAATGVAVAVVPADLGEPDGAAGLLEELRVRGLEVDVLVNNAGYVVAGNFLDVDWGTHARFLQVLVVSYAELTHGLLPGMLERRFGRIVQVASVAGLVPSPPGQTLYGAVKAWTVRFAEALQGETLGTGVHVTALCPGLTRTEFHAVAGTEEQSASFPDWQWSSASAVAGSGWRAVEANRTVVVPGLFWSVMSALTRMLPLPLAHHLIRRRAASMGRGPTGANS